MLRLSDVIAQCRKTLGVRDATRLVKLLMMKIQLKLIVSAVCALVLCSFQVADAGTIIKLSLGSDAAADYEFSGGLYTGGAAGVMSTIDDGNGATMGEQDTAIEFLDFLSSFPNIPAGASYTMSDLHAVTPATTAFGYVFQDLTGGTFQLWDDLNNPLLLVGLTTSTIVAQIGNPSGAVLTTTLGTPLGGPLAPYIVPGSVSISIALSDIKSGLATGVVFVPLDGGVGTLNPFTADATKTVLADGTGIPEPTSTVLVVIGMMIANSLRRRSA
jgi:hypothetical protein